MQWYRKNADNLDWFLQMQSDGVDVKALHSMPSLMAAEEFYYFMYSTCGNDFSNINIYCTLHGLSKWETIEAIEILSQISAKV